MSDKPKTARDRQREETRQKVFTAALEVFRRDGVTAARIEEIVQLAGVSRGTFYFHFPTKEDVLTELLEQSQSELVARLDALPVDAPIEQVMDEIAEGIAERWQDDPQLLVEIGTVALRMTGRGLEGMADSYPALKALIPRFVGAAERNELETLIPPEILASFFLVNLFGAALAWCGQPTLMDLELLLKNTIQFFLRAARPG